MTDRIYVNPGAASFVCDSSGLGSESQVLSFHEQLPLYAETPLHALPSVAEELQIGQVFLKDESNRFGLPSFKILGASWAIFRAVSEKLGLAFDTTQTDGDQLLSSLGDAARQDGLWLVTCTEGNWGRAVARMAKYLDIKAKILVPDFMPGTTKSRIRNEGAEVVVVDGNYDDAVAATRREAEQDAKAILVMDMGWAGYKIIPQVSFSVRGLKLFILMVCQWVVEGYSTMLNESDLQIEQATNGRRPTHAFVPVGVGSVAHAVTEHFKRSEEGHACRATVLTVEPTTAPGLKASLEAGDIVSVSTGDTIMCGMNCGTVSSTAWPALKAGVDADILVTDQESHMAVEELKHLDINAGPCGASTLAALRKVCREAKNQLGLDKGSIIILYCTEGSRDYHVPA